MKQLFLNILRRKDRVDRYLIEHQAERPRGVRYPTALVALVTAFLTASVFALGYTTKQDTVREVKVHEWPNTKCAKYDWSGVGGTKECLVWKRLKSSKEFNKVQK